MARRRVILVDPSVVAFLSAMSSPYGSIAVGIQGYPPYGTVFKETHYLTVYPPSMTIVSPVMYDEASDAR